MAAARDADDERLRARWQRMGAAEGTGFGLLAAGAVMGMAWLGGLLGSVAAVGPGRYALLFLGLGAVVLTVSLIRERRDGES